MSFKLFTIAVLLFLAQSCSKYDDNQYGKCYVKKVTNIPGSDPTLKGQTIYSFEYDQHDMLTSVSISNPNINGKMNVIYNNEYAFMDFFVNNHKTASAECKLNSEGYIQSLTVDTNNTTLVDATIEYIPNNLLKHIKSLFPFDDMVVDYNVSYEGLDPVLITQENLKIKCKYTSIKSSLKLGKGNIGFMAGGDLPTFYAEHLLKSWIIESPDFTVEFNFTYDFDSDDKVRKIYYSTVKGDQFGTMLIEYDCY